MPLKARKLCNAELEKENKNLAINQLLECDCIYIILFLTLLPGIAPTGNMRVTYGQVLSPAVNNEKSHFLAYLYHLYCLHPVGVLYIIKRMIIQ